VCPVEAGGGGAHVSRARVAAAWRRTRLAIALYAPLSPARLSALEFSLSFLYRTPPLSLVSLLAGVSLARPLAERIPSPPFSFSPLKLAQGAHHGDVVPHLVTHW
jgi:hypothetical protein